LLSCQDQRFRNTGVFTTSGWQWIGNGCAFLLLWGTGEDDYTLLSGYRRFDKLVVFLSRNMTVHLEHGISLDHFGFHAKTVSGVR
jgi:hypothetical protein